MGSRLRGNDEYALQVITDIIDCLYSVAHRMLAFTLG
jgi:hypothetical protein